MTARSAALFSDAATLMLVVLSLAALGVATADCDRRVRLSRHAPGDPSPATIALIRARGVPLRAVVFAAPSDATGAHIARYFHTLADGTELVHVEVVDALAVPVRAAELDVRDNGTIALLRMDEDAVERDVLEVGHDGSSGRFAVARLDGDVRASLRRLLAPRPNVSIAGQPSAELEELLRRAGMLRDGRRAATIGTAPREMGRDDLLLALAPPLTDDAALAARVRGGRGLMFAGTPGPLLDAALAGRGLRFVRVDARAAQAFVIGAHPAVAEVHARVRVVPWEPSAASALLLDRSAAARAALRLATLLAVRDDAERVHTVAVALEPSSARAPSPNAPRRSLVLTSTRPFESSALRSDAGALLVVEMLRWLLERDTVSSELRTSEPPFAPRSRRVLGASVAAFLATPSIALAVAVACARRQRRR